MEIDGRAGDVALLERHHDGHEHDVEGLRGALRARAISLRTMDARLRLVVAVGVGELLAAALMLVLSHTVLAARFSVGFSMSVSDHVTVFMPVATFDACTGFLALAWSFVLAGAFHARLPVRVVALLVFSAVTLAPIIEIGALATRWGESALILLAALWALGVVTWLLDRRAPGSRHPEDDRSVRLRPLVAVLPGCLVVLVYAAPWLIGGVPAASVTWAFTRQLGFLSVALVPLLFAAGADWAEWGEVLGERLIAPLGGPRRHTWAAALTGIVAAAVILDEVLSLDGSRLAVSVSALRDLLPQLVVAAIAGALLLGVARVARIAEDWPEEIPFLAPLLCAVLIMGLYVGAALAYGRGGSLLDQNTFVNGWVAIGGLLAALAAGAILLALRGRRPGVLQMGAMFFVVAGLLLGLRGLDLAVTIVAGRSSLPYLGTHAIQIAVALVTLGAVIWHVARRTVDRGAPLLAVLFTVNVALVLLLALRTVYDVAQARSDTSVVVQGVIIVLALLWDIAMSGQAITNGGGRWFPRHSRILLYFGYIMLVATAVLYFSAPAPDAALPEGIDPSGWPRFDTEFWPQNGIIGLGVPLLLTVLLVRAAHMGRGRHGRTLPAPDGARE